MFIICHQSCHSIIDSKAQRGRRGQASDLALILRAQKQWKCIKSIYCFDFYINGLVIVAAQTHTIDAFVKQRHHNQNRSEEEWKEKEREQMKSGQWTHTYIYRSQSFTLFIFTLLTLSWSAITHRPFSFYSHSSQFSVAAIDLPTHEQELKNIKFFCIPKNSTNDHEVWHWPRQ